MGIWLNWDLYCIAFQDRKQPYEDFIIVSFTILRNYAVAKADIVAEFSNNVMYETQLIEYK